MPPFNAPSWKELVQRLSPAATSGRPVDEDRLASVERSLGLRLPVGLREFLAEADGLTDDYGSKAVLPIADIERLNREFWTTETFRELYMPFDNLLFFGEDSGGDRFAFAIHADGRIHKHDVLRWEHETDSRSWYAGRLEQFLERRLAEGD